MAGLLLLAFLMPFSKWNWLSEPLVVLLYFPMLIALGAGLYLAYTPFNALLFDRFIAASRQNGTASLRRTSWTSKLRSCPT